MDTQYFLLDPLKSVRQADMFVEKNIITTDNSLIPYPEIVK